MIKFFHFIKKTPPDGVVVSMIFGKNHGNPSHYDLHIENFNSCELKFSIEYQYNSLQGNTATFHCPRFIYIYLPLIRDRSIQKIRASENGDPDQSYLLPLS